MVTGKKVTWLLLMACIIQGGWLLTSYAGGHIVRQTQDRPPYQLNYQGYLTDGQGRPLQGIHALSFALATAVENGTTVWGPETHAAVSVQRGLFSVVLGETIPMSPALFRQALFLEVSINEETTMPRQPLRTVPYAFNLLPGATIEGEPVGSVYGLSVVNTALTEQSRGLWAVGHQYGLVVQETGPGDVALKSTSFIEAEGYKSLRPSMWWTAGQHGHPAMPTQLNMQTTLTGTAMLHPTEAGTQQFFVPLSLPTALYGQAVSVQALTLRYQTSHAESGLRNVQLVQQSSVDGLETLINQPLQLSSTEPASHTITLSPTITLQDGPLNLAIELDFTEATHTVSIGGVGLILGHGND